MAADTIRDSPATKKGPGGGKGHYIMPIKVCATCGQTTKGSFHERCKRVNGQLVIVNKKR